MKNPVRVELVLAGYRRHVQLEAEELERLAGLIRARPLAITAWRLGHGEVSAAQAAASAESVCEQSDAVAARVRARTPRA
jgi:Ser/Thr protein kinase RdoA (MazF antagonist)